MDCAARLNARPLTSDAIVDSQSAKKLAIPESHARPSTGTVRTTRSSAYNTHSNPLMSCNETDIIVTDLIDLDILLEGPELAHLPPRIVVVFVENNDCSRHNTNLELLKNQLR